MGIFGKKDDTKATKVASTGEKKDAKKAETPKVDKKEVKKEEKKEVKKPTKVTIADTSAVIKRPRITEKAALLSENGVYTFEVTKGATKYEVRDAVKAIYKVTPVKVNIVNRKPRHSMSRSRGRDVMEHGLRKAYVYLKEGDRIELV